MSDGPNLSVAPTPSPTPSAEARAIEALADLVAVYQARSTQPTRSDVRTDLAPIMTLLRQAGQEPGTVESLAPFLAAYLHEDKRLCLHNAVSDTWYVEVPFARVREICERDHPPTAVEGPQGEGEAPAEADVTALAAWFHEHVTAETFAHATDEDFAYGLLASDWLASDRARLLARAEAAEAEVTALRETLRVGTELDNHHNAAVCPYCTPERLIGEDPEAAARVTEVILAAWMAPVHGCDGTDQGCFTTGCPVPAYQMLNPDGLAREAASAVVEAGFGTVSSVVARVEAVRQEMYAEARREDLLPSPRHYIRVFADRVGRAIGTGQTAQTEQPGQPGSGDRTGA